jgi:DNA repair protein RadA/Sms
MPDEIVRHSTKLSAVDHVLEGGLVDGSTVLLAGRPGTGKTSLVLQVLSGLGRSCLYATGEETRPQVEARRKRVGASFAEIHVVTARKLDLDKILAQAQKVSARAIAIDTIYQLVCADLDDDRPGTPTQLKKCVERLSQHTKQTRTALWLIGRVTGDGSIGGPAALQHTVDVVLELERGMESNELRLRCLSKNRFGATSRVGCLEISDQGLVSINGAVHA